MKRWIVAVGAWGAAAGCGRDSGEAPDTDARKFAATQDDPAPVYPDLLCAGPSLDGAQGYRVLAFRGSDQRPERAILQRSATPDDDTRETLGDFREFRDLTPPPPSDVRYRLVFEDLTTPATGFSVMLAEGGFTDEATTEIKAVSADGAVVASLTCMRQ